jgi:uncharacterized protein
MNFQIPHHIKRAMYTERVKPFMGKSIIKVFTGQRRVGKSYLLFQLMTLIKEMDAEANIIYINKEDLRFQDISTGIELNTYVLENKVPGRMNYVFVDEIQDILNFEIGLRSLLLDESIDLYCTGSNAQMLAGDIAGYLSGRYIEIQIFSLTYIEFLEFHQLEDAEKSLYFYIKFGGLPYLKHLPLQDDIVYEYLKNVYGTIVYRDVINRFSIRNTVFLEQLVLFLASNTGSLFSSKKISDFLKSQKVNISPNQVQLYIKHLCNAFLLHQVVRFDIQGKRLFEIGEKYYFENLGIRNALWGYRIQDLGKLYENVVYNHLVASGYDVKIGILGTDKEIDFMGEKKGERLYIQVALHLNDEKTIEREFGNLLKIQDNYPKVVISSQSFEGNSYMGISVIDLRRFLTSPLRNNRYID